MPYVDPSTLLESPKVQRDVLSKNQNQSESNLPRHQHTSFIFRHTQNKTNWDLMPSKMPMKLSSITLLTLLGSSSLIVSAGSTSNNNNNGKRNAFLKHPLLQAPKAFVSSVITGNGSSSNTVVTDPSCISGGAAADLILGDDVADIPLSQSPTLQKNDAPLMRDINMLTEILLDIVEQEDPKVHDLYKEFLGYGRLRYVFLFFLKLNSTTRAKYNGLFRC